MAEDKFCKSCPDRSTCKDVYQRLGKSGGKSVTKKVFLAFILPIAAFIAGLAVFEKLLANTIQKPQIRSVTALLLSLVLTFILILVLRMFTKTEKQENNEG